MPIVSTIQLLLNDSGVFWPESQILDAVNQAQLWGYAKTKWVRTSWPINLPVGADLITLPSDVLVPGWMEARIVNSDSTVSFIRAFPSTQRELEHFLRTWRSTSLGAPMYFVIWDSHTLRVFPRPDKPYTYTLWGVAYPTEITSSSQDIQGPINYTLIIQNFTMSLLLNATRPDLAEYYLNLAEVGLVQFAKHLRNQQSHNIRRLVPTTSRFQINQGGSIKELPTYYPLEC